MKRNPVKAAAGFTLIEILVVIFIISIVTSIAILSIGHNENKKLEAFASDLTQMISLAEEQAMLQPAILGILLQNRTIQWMAWQPVQNGRQSGWLPLQDKLLGLHAVPANVELKLMIGSAVSASQQDKNIQTPQITISTNGDITPFRLYVGKRGQPPRYVITGDTDGNVTTTTLSS